ncbi:MAG: LamG domain-containing protein [Polyangiaceae bacterium]
MGAALFAPACGLVSGLDALDRSPDAVSLEAGADAPSPGDAAADTKAVDGASDTSTAIDAGTDTGIDAGTTYAAAVLASSPIAYYRLDETSGSIISSAVFGAPHGTFTRGVTLGTLSPITSSPSNRAATFALKDANDSDLSFGNNFAFEGTASFTIEVWVKPGLALSGGQMHVFSKADRIAGGPLTGWSVCIDSASVLGTNVWVERVVGATSILSPKTSIVPGKFTHVVAVYDGSLTIYTNGSAFVGPADARAITATTTSAFAGSADGLSGYGFVGELDELAIYDKALTHAQILAHYMIGKP